jgi:hypothetical protein
MVKSRRMKCKKPGRKRLLLRPKLKWEIKIKMAVILIGFRIRTSGRLL